MNDIYLVVDTETTKFAKDGSYVQEGQERVCQIAMLLVDSEGKSLAEFSCLIKPDNWTISEGAGAIHGFTDEQCEQYGLNFKSVISLYHRFCAMATHKIAHNAEFDAKMMCIEEAYAELTPCSKPWICTMKPNTNIVKAPHKTGTGYKWPSLEEALQFFCGRGLGDGAHDAMIDVRGCKDVFFAAKSHAV